VQPTTSLTVTTEHSPNLATTTNSSAGGRSGSSSSAKKGHSASASRPPRSTVISLQQQQLLKSHLDSILDVTILRAPYGMTVSVDRAGMVYVFQ